MVFINRENELKYLNNEYRDKKSRFVVIYGKRRVGKTELVKQFFKDIPHIYFLADKAPEKDQLQLLSEKIGLLFNDEFLLSRGFGTWYEFFRYIRNKGRIAVIIDEFPFLIEANSAIPSIFQKGWDEDLKNSGTFLILLGSSIGMMETEVLGYKSPLFGRRTGQLFIEPLTFWNSKKFFPEKFNDEFMYIYSILGGTPAYLLQFEPSMDLWANIKEKILKPQAYLFNEPEFILREELREPRNYFSILKAISMGKTRASEIINETGFEKNVVGKYLSVLAELRIIKRDVPVTEKSYEKSKKGMYMIDDNFFRFWFNFVFPNKSYIEEGEVEYVIKNKIKSRLDIFASLTFEDVSRSFVKIGLKKGIMFNKVGRWWSKDSEIDIVAINDDENSILFGEAKWSTKKVGTDILTDLKRKSSMVEWGKKNRKEYYALFSRKGFTEEVKMIAEKEGVFLIGVEEINI
ncbi:MAG: ATPase [Nitrospinae bacterium RIFCSPLOWO2_12_39_16]|nr:MAG: ATPase [Nitrospinae bacterium RIFCSPLOWO2_02_39_17]OGW08756.1 MAG: ATPase [Nitrospinae bacterium RIFCSPLOWO2_12_39_16]